MVSHLRSDLLHLLAIGVLSEQDRVRHSRIHKVILPPAALELDSFAQSNVSRFGHLQPHVVAVNGRPHLAGLGFEREIGVFAGAVLIIEPGDTTRPVAAHFRFAAVGVIVAHREIGGLGRLDQQDPVRTNAKATMTDSGNGFRIGREISLAIVGNDKIVARSAHFVEFQMHPGGFIAQIGQFRKVLMFILASGLLSLHSMEFKPQPDLAERPSDAFVFKAILLVDDDQQLAVALQWILADQNFLVDMAHDGEEALLKIKANEYDAIICDVMMPRLRGDELYQQAVDMRPLLGDRFIFITGFAADPKINLFLSQTGVKYLMKPFPVQTLIDCVRQLLE